MSRIELINASCADQTVDAVVNFAVTPKAFKELFNACYNSLKGQRKVKGKTSDN